MNDANRTERHQKLKDRVKNAKQKREVTQFIENIEVLFAKCRLLINQSLITFQTQIDAFFEKGSGSADLIFIKQKDSIDNAINRVKNCCNENDEEQEIRKEFKDTLQDLKRDFIDARNSFEKEIMFNN